QMQKRGVTILLSTEVKGLMHDAGRVAGVQLENGEILSATRGVVLATGGYEGNAELVHRFEGFPDWMNPFGPKNTGDALVLGSEIGAAVSRIGVNNSLFIGAEIPGSSNAFFSVGLRGLPMPGAIAVNER